MDSESENITILLISSSKLLKNKFIEALNNSLNQFTLMNKTIESLKSSNERILVPCLISDYTLETETNTNYVQLVDASDTSLINNLISRSINSPKAFQFYINAIVYLYDEANPDTFYYVKSIHTDIKKTFSEFAANDSLLFLICNMINAATIGHQQTSTNSKLISLLDKFLAEFNNMQYVSQEYEDTILGPKQKINDENKLKTNFDQLVSRNIAKIKLGLNKKKLSKLAKKSEDTDVPSINIRSESESIKSVDLDVSSKSNELINKAKASKKIYQGEMAHNLRNGFGIYQYDNKFFRYEGEWKNGIKNGQGKLIMKDGSYIEGEFKNGEIFGKGYKYDKFRESEYTGDFLEGCYHGKGTMRSKNNFVYQGGIKLIKINYYLINFIILLLKKRFL